MHKGMRRMMCGYKIKAMCKGLPRTRQIKTEDEN